MASRGVRFGLQFEQLEVGETLRRGDPRSGLQRGDKDRTECDANSCLGCALGTETGTETDLGRESTATDYVLGSGIVVGRGGSRVVGSYRMRDRDCCGSKSLGNGRNSLQVNVRRNRVKVSLEARRASLDAFRVGLLMRLQLHSRLRL